MRLSILYLIVFLVLIGTALRAQIPDDPSGLTQPASYEEMAVFLDEIADNPLVTVTVEGKTVQDRSLFLVRLQHPETRPEWKILFFAQQHGNEPAGKDALLILIKKIVADPSLLPPGVGLWILPMVNPDGAEAGTRRNGNDADLNRDHQILMQPETRTLHRVYRRVMPHVSVDCHEFGRDSRDYAENGWLEWPQIMMDYANNPMIDPAVVEAGARWCSEAESCMAEKGFNYCRYHVGGRPPLEEQRYSTTDVDDARNGLGLYNGLSFIIESGLLRNTDSPQADLPDRAAAYLALLERFIYASEYREKDIETVASARNHFDRSFIPVNYFWGNVGGKVTEVNVIRLDNGTTACIPTPNFMTDLVIKSSVTTPAGYIISDTLAAPFTELLDQHDIPYKLLKQDAVYYSEICSLVRVEEDFDTLYNRYAGRQIVKGSPRAERSYRAGSLLVELNGPGAGRAIQLLEPYMLYGIYRYDTFKGFATLPVHRIFTRGN